MPELRPTAMISSTSQDLPDHRAAMIEACQRVSIIPVAMEFLAAQSAADALSASLTMVEEGDIYVLILAQRYGYRPHDPARNPDQRSITELEYRHAQALGKPILVFVMADDHPITPAVVEHGDAHDRLVAFRAELLTAHVVSFYHSVADMQAKGIQALYETRQTIPLKMVEPDPNVPPLPIPPALYTSSDYILGGNLFVGRTRELNRLHAWGAAPDPIMVVEGIGGLGKSALTWHWIREHAARHIPDLAGVVWWSFYEGGTTLRSMVRYTLAYITRTDPEDYRREHPDALKRRLLQELKKGRYLLVFDGFERALVAYHRWQAEYMTDAEVDEVEAKATKEEAVRACTDPADGAFLSQLVSAGPSKFLFSTRLLPLPFQDRASRKLLTGVQHIHLNGLAPHDAYTLLLDSGVSHATRATVDGFLERFGYHSLLVKVVAGLVSDYAPAPGDFDAWLQDEGRRVTLTDLDLSQRQSNILAYAFDGLDEQQQRLLGLVAAFSGAAQWTVLTAINPYPDTKALVAALRALTERGLVQWDKGDNTYDLHPIVRAHTIERMNEDERVAAYERLHQHFSSLPPDDTENATELKHIETSIEIYRTLLGAGHYDEAARFWRRGLEYSFAFHVAAYPVALGLLKPLFRDGDDQPPPLSDLSDQGWIMNDYAVFLSYMGQHHAALHMRGLKIKLNAEQRDAPNLGVGLGNYAVSLGQLNRLAQEARVHELRRDLSSAAAVHDGVAMAHYRLFGSHITTGQWATAAAAYQAFIADPPYSQRDNWLSGAERWQAAGRVMRGEDAQATLDGAETLAQRSHDAFDLREVARWRGEAAVQQGDGAGAIEHFRRAAQMAQQHGSGDASGYLARLGLAHALNGDHEQALHYLAEALQGRNQAADDIDITVAEVYLAVGDPEQARRYALAGYTYAWADGPPYVHWWRLQRATRVLEALGEPLPDLPPYDPAQQQPFEFEAAVRAFIAELEAEKAERERQAAEDAEADDAGR